MRRSFGRSRVRGQVPTTPPVVDPLVPPIVVPPAPGVPPVEPTTPPAPVTPETPQTFTKEYVDSLRQESAKYRTEKNTAEAALKVLQDAQMTAEQKIASDLKALQDVTVPALEQENRKLKVQVAASALGIVDPEVASMLIDWTAIEAGRSINDALTDLLVTRAYLKGSAAATPPVVPPIAPVAPPSSSAPATPPSDAPGTRVYTKSELSRMSQREMASIMADVELAAKQGRIDYTK